MVRPLCSSERVVFSSWPVIGWFGWEEDEYCSEGEREVGNEGRGTLVEKAIAHEGHGSSFG